MKLPSPEELSQVIGGIYDAGLDGARWVDVLPRITRMLDGMLATVWLQDGRGRILQYDPMPDKSNRDYAAYYARLDALLPAVVAAPVSTVLTNAGVTSRSEHLRSEFWADFARPNGFGDCMQVRLFDAPGVSGFFGVTSSVASGPFGVEARRAMQLLQPHLSRALQSRLRLEALGVVGHAALEALDRLAHGVLIVDGTMRVLHANTAAERVLARGDVLSASGDRLTAGTSRDAGALRRLVFQAADAEGAVARSGLLRMERASGAAVLLSVVPLRADHPWTAAAGRAALVTVGDPDVPGPIFLPATLHALYGLTPMEAAVAARIGRAETVDTIAELMSIRTSTIRTHLNRAFAKTGTSRQAELVRLVSQISLMESDGREVG